MAEARLSYCVLHEDGNRFPESGWLDGTVTDLADLIRLVSVPQKAVNDAAAALEQGIGYSANELDDMAKLRPNITPAIARLLHRADGAAYPAVRPEVVADSQVVTPVESTYLLDCFSEVISPLLEKTEKNQAETRSLVALRDELLPCLVTGELQLEDGRQDE